MEQSKQQQIRKLTDRLNRCRYEYYNLNAPSLTDAEYDALFDELSTLEKETGFSMTNSPTQTVVTDIPQSCPYPSPPQVHLSRPYMICSAIHSTMPSKMPMIYEAVHCPPLKKGVT